MKTYTEQEIRELAMRGKADPASLSLAEIQAIALYSLHRNRRLALWDGEKFVAVERSPRSGH